MVVAFSSLLYMKLGDDPQAESPTDISGQDEQWAQILTSKPLTPMLVRVYFEGAYYLVLNEPPMPRISFRN